MLVFHCWYQLPQQTTRNMDVKTYKSISQFIKNFRGLSKDCLKQLEEKHPGLSHDTLYSILSLEYQKRMRCNHIKTTAYRNKYWDAYQTAVNSGESPGIIVRMAEKYDVAPCLIAKLILQRFFNDETMNANSYMRCTASIPNMDLAYEVFLCTLYDNLYSPLSETMKHSLGQQYEILLHHQIVKLKLAFRDEEDLRKYGYDKTPDVKLEVPVAIDGHIINWIESKALFGDETAHRDYMNSQYLSYWNRFGPGLVIYWFGYLETIVEPNDRRFIIRDHLPTDVTRISLI